MAPETATRVASLLHLAVEACNHPGLFESPRPRLDHVHNDRAAANRHDACSHIVGEEEIVVVVVAVVTTSGVFLVIGLSLRIMHSTDVAEKRHDNSSEKILLGPRSIPVIRQIYYFVGHHGTGNNNSHSVAMVDGASPDRHDKGFPRICRRGKVWHSSIVHGTRRHRIIRAQKAGSKMRTSFEETAFSQGFPKKCFVLDIALCAVEYCYQCEHVKIAGNNGNTG